MAAEQCLPRHAGATPLELWKSLTSGEKLGIYMGALFGAITSMRHRGLRNAARLWVHQRSSRPIPTERTHDSGTR